VKGEPAGKPAGYSEAMIPIDTRDPTLELIRSEIVVRQKQEKPREYIGASSIGDECARKLWYQLRMPQAADTFDAATLMRFDDGHRTEALLIERMRLAGLSVIDRDDTGEQLRFSHCGGLIAGHIDGLVTGLVQAPKKTHIFEAKCVGDRVFSAFCKLRGTVFEKDVLRSWNMKYYVQAQLYMHFSKQFHSSFIDRHYTIVASAGGRDMQSCRTEYDRETALRYIDRAERIAVADREPPRMSDKPDFWLCRMCQFNKECHR